MANKKSTNVGAIAAGLAGLTAAAVGAYYLYGSKDAAKNRLKVKGWMLKAKGEVLEQLENVQDVTESTYMTALDAVMKKYNELKNIEPAELEAFVNEMKTHWSGLTKTAAKKKTVKKAAKKGKK